MGPCTELLSLQSASHQAVSDSCNFQNGNGYDDDDDDEFICQGACMCLKVIFVPKTY